MNALVVEKAALDAVIAALPADDLAGVRRAAADRFAALGFPTVRQEDWKYTSLEDIADLTAEWLGSAAATATRDVEGDARLESSLTAAVEADWIIIRDGIAARVLPAIDGIDLQRISGRDLQMCPAEDAMSAFNAALLRDGIRITTRKAAAPNRPLGILYIDDPSNAIAQTRVILDLEADSKLQLIEVCASAGRGRQFTNSVVEAQLARGAQLNHVRLQIREEDHSGVSRFQANLAKDARLNQSGFEFGGALSRNDVVANIAGTGATVLMNGLYLSSGQQHIDNHTSIVHGVGPSHSDEEYRGILAGRSRCVFNGKVVVAKGADGTDSSQSNHNLLLSDRAEIDTKPELEIYADDVKCAHGATVGQLDMASLFYLRSRGLGEDQARQLLTRAFAAGMLGSLAIADCHDLVAEKLDEKLAALVGDR